MRERLSKEEWDKLDCLIGKHGFGGYYDLVECLKGVLEEVGKDTLVSGWRNEVNDLPGVVYLLMRITTSSYLKRKKSEKK